MPRKQLYRNKDFIQIVITAEEKAAFDQACAANQTTMSDVLRKAIAQYLASERKKATAW